jgi:hypothetical protein
LASAELALKPLKSAEMGVSGGEKKNLLHESKITSMENRRVAGEAGAGLAVARES